MSAVVDTNVLIRHVTRDPPDQAQRATRVLASSEELILTDPVLAEFVFVLESNYRYEREGILVEALSLLSLPSIVAPNHEILIRAVRLYGATSLHFVDAYEVAFAELEEEGRLVSFDRDFDRVPTIERVEP